MSGPSARTDRLGAAAARAQVAAAVAGIKRLEARAAWLRGTTGQGELWTPVRAANVAEAWALEQRAARARRALARATRKEAARGDASR